MNLSFAHACEVYAAYGVDVQAAMRRCLAVPLSLHCWQADDVKGFLNRDCPGGGIMATGSYPGAARNAEEVRADLSAALGLLPGVHRLNLHAIYADTEEKVDLPDLQPRHFASWMDFARQMNLGLDFNPTYFAHPMASSGFTLSSADQDIQQFWIAHGRACREIAAAFAASTLSPCVLNDWFPDGSKELPADPAAPRARMAAGLDAMRKNEPGGVLSCLEGKVFGLGVESYTVVSNDFALGYAATRNSGLTLDAGHFHPSESVADKLSTARLFAPHILLHLSRPVRWDSDHVVMQNDDLLAVADVLAATDTLEKTYIGLDYFDASINRVAAYVIGARAARCAILRALLTPHALLQQAEADADATARLALREACQSLPWTAVYAQLLEEAGCPADMLPAIRQYESTVLSKRIDRLNSR